MTPMDLAAAGVAELGELFAGEGEGFFPADGLELAVGLADERLW